MTVTSSLKALLHRLALLAGKLDLFKLNPRDGSIISNHSGVIPSDDLKQSFYYALSATKSSTIISACRLLARPVFVLRALNSDVAKNLVERTCAANITPQRA
jgi:hypothetical protein